MTELATCPIVGDVKVLFDHGNPFFLAHGGFQIQIEQTRLALEGIGISAEFLKWWDSSQKADILHYFGRPHPAYIEQARQKKLPVVFTELLGGLGSRSGIHRGIQKLIIQASRRLLPKDFTVRMAWESFCQASAAIANTQWERQLMISMFNAPPKKVFVLPNGVEKIFFREDRPDPGREKFLICTATITPRKRVLELCLAAQIGKVPLQIVGAPYSENDRYYLEFLKILQKPGSTVQYCKGISSRTELASKYKSASGFVLLSAMETRSLSAEEAAAAGCPLFLSDLPWARSVFGDSATYCPISSPESTARHLAVFMGNLAKAPLPRRPCTWQEVAEQLKEIYREAMTSR